MSVLKAASGRLLPRLCISSRISKTQAWRPATFHIYTSVQWRGQHSRPSRYPENQQKNKHPVMLQQSQFRQPEPQQDAELQFQRSETINEESYGPLPRPRYIIPTIWAVFATGFIYTSLAYMEAKSELEREVRLQSFSSAPQWNRGPPTPTEVVTGAWKSMDPVGRVGAGIIGTNLGIHVASYVMTETWRKMWHTPARNVNYSLFTSMWVHSGGMHIFFNTYALWSFIRPVGYSEVFKGDTYHLLSFFLSAGVISGLAQHWSTLLPKIGTPNFRPRPEVWTPSGGASGALLGLLGVFCCQYPHAGLGIMFIPYYLEAQYVLPAFMMFDFVGMVRPFKTLNLGHAAHLGGAIVGLAYAANNGREKIWEPLVLYWRRRLRAQAQR